MILAGAALGAASQVGASESESNPPRSPSFDAVAEDPVWRALLHQARRRIDQKTREAMHEAHFFYHPQGATRPDLELVATREAMSGPDAARSQTERCRFPARHQFLAEHGQLPVDRGSCPEFDSWRATIGDVVLTLIFPEAFLGNPSSMFGHTLLRFDPVAGDAMTSPETLLGWTLDYTADAGEDIGLLYMLRGLFGGYRGKFGIAPYYEKTRVYSDWQDRDIWEYPLSMPSEARERVLLHVWELRGVALPYFFFTQNCSEKLLEVLEVGWPGLGRGGGIPPTVTPVDTLRAMAKMSPDAVGLPRLRRSPATRLQESLGALDRVEAKRIDDLAAGRLTPDAQSIEMLPPEDRARALSLAYDLLRHNFLAGEISAEDARTRSNALLLARSRIPVPTTSPPELERLERVAPDEGHGTARVGLFGGLQDREYFIELRAQPAFHTALDAPGGFAEGGEIKFLDSALRYYPEKNRVRLQELVVLDVTTASPWRRPFRPLAWHTEIGLRSRLVEKQRGSGLEPASVFRVQGGLGAALAPVPRLHLYAFGEVVLEAGAALEGNAAIGPLVRAGGSWSTRKGGYTLHIEGVAGALAGRDPSAWLAGKIEQRITLSRNWSLVLGGHFEQAYDVGHFEGRLGILRYF